MRPNGEELLRGVAGTLATYIMPEVQTAHAQLEMALVIRLLGIAADDWDGAAQRLVDASDAMRELARRGAEAIADSPEAAGTEISSLADELRSLADADPPSLRLSELSAAHEQLRGALARFGILLQDSEAAELQEYRAAIINRLREEGEANTLAMLGPRADG